MTVSPTVTTWLPAQWKCRIGAGGGGGGQGGGAYSRRREFCHSADALSPSTLTRLLKVEGGAAA